MPDAPVTLRDVAVRAGVHPATASRALNPETRILVSEDTARRVLDAAEALGYSPNPVARSLRTRRSHTTASAFVPADCQLSMPPGVTRRMLCSASCASAWARTWMRRRTPT